MSVTMIITSATTDDEIDTAIQFDDMRDAAKRHRNDCRGEAGAIMRLHDIDGVIVLEDRNRGMYINENGVGTGNSMIIEAFSAELAAQAWRDPSLLD